MFTIELCKTKDAYKAVTSAGIDLDTLRRQETVLLDAGLVVVIRVDAIEVICHSYGELMIKTADEEKAQHIAQHMENYETERRPTP